MTEKQSKAFKKGFKDGEKFGKRIIRKHMQRAKKTGSSLDIAIAQRVIRKASND